MLLRVLRILVLALLFCFVLVLPAAAKVDTKALEDELMCYCECNMVLSSCECEDAAIMRNDIQQMADSGKDKDAILAAFVERYGEPILTRPRASGFNLAAWIVPVLGLLAGIVLVFIFIKKGSQGTAADSIPDEEQFSSDQDYEEMLEEKIKKYIF